MNITKDKVKVGMTLRWKGSDNTIRGGEVVDLTETGCIIWNPNSGPNHPGSFYYWEELLKKNFIAIGQPG